MAERDTLSEGATHRHPDDVGNSQVQTIDERARGLGLLAVAVIVVAAVVVTGAESAPRPTVRIAEKLGRDVRVPPGTMREARAVCPRGYFAIGGGHFAGSLDVIYETTSGNRRAWEVGYGNPPDGLPEAKGSALAICIRGDGRVRVRQATATTSKRGAVRAWTHAQP